MKNCCPETEREVLAGIITNSNELIRNKKILNEDTLAKKLWSFRKENKDCIEPSFDTISAAGPNAAMCHYNHLNSDNPSKLPENLLYLLYSGAQYLYGTTDVTRTIAIGKPTQKMIDAYTLVLKGHISVSKSLFPEGTSGSQIDTFARQYLWEYGLDFAHGNGHGVDFFLLTFGDDKKVALDEVSSGYINADSLEALDIRAEAVSFDMSSQQFLSRGDVVSLSYSSTVNNSAYYSANNNTLMSNQWVVYVGASVWQGFKMQGFGGNIGPAVDVSEPGALALFALGLAFMARRKQVS